MTNWADALPSPIGFVLSGGATLGVLQVGMLEALAERGIAPDLVVGTSIGALNGAVLASAGSVEVAARRLAEAWEAQRSSDVFPGSRIMQATRLARGLSIFPDDGLRTIIRSSLSEERIEELRLPFGAVVTEARTGHPRLVTSGELTPALLASAAIPAVFPPVRIGQQDYWDGGVASNVPLKAALHLGARSVVVLDVGDLCHRRETPAGVAETILTVFSTAIRQRVLVEAPAVSAEVPVLYLPRPCVTDRGPLERRDAARLIGESHDLVATFLASVDPPSAGSMAGEVHHHDVNLSTL